MCHGLLSDARLYATLWKFDQDLAAQTRAARCGCGGTLHSARYPRKPRGGPPDLGPAYDRRLSFCCAVEGCRQRTTPPSVRFLGRRVYLSAVVVLVAAMRQGISPARATRLHDLLGVSLRTLKRWRTWWREVFVRGPFWKRARGRFAPPVDGGRLPASLLERFAGDDEATRLVATLAFLAPITTASARAPVGNAGGG